MAGDQGEVQLMARQFIRCRFGPLDKRAYTYLNEGRPVAVGDFVKVEARGGDVWRRVEVMEVDAEEPTGFECKAILGLVTDEETYRCINPKLAPVPTGPLI